MNSTTQSLLDKAKERAAQNELPYCGSLSPTEAWALLQSDPDAVLVDVRTQAELDWVGQVSFSEDRWMHIEWSTYPEGTRNEDFVAQVKSRIDPNQTILLLCRSGARSHNAAALLVKHGFDKAINVLEGFEGDKDDLHRRSSINGWRKHGLPWEQH
ncbi:MAG: rhodanese-like domain-containing protein [Limnobacter sp.]|nr:rhodanese-like domain-containing protein [Limnobacter sp.]